MKYRCSGWRKRNWGNISRRNLSAVPGPAEQALNLFEMIDVVAGDHGEEALDALLAAFGVHAVLLPLFWREGFEQGEVGFAEDAELFEGLAGVALCVMARSGPSVLVKRLDGRAGRAQYRTHAPAGHNFNVCQVRKNLIH